MLSALALAILDGGFESHCDAAQPHLGTRTVPLLTINGVRFRDLNRDGILEPYEEWRLPSAVRAADLLSRMTLGEKAGAMMHATAPSTLNEQYDLPRIKDLIAKLDVTTFITRLSVPPAELATDNNDLQALAEKGRLGIPLLISTDPRSHFDTVTGASVSPVALRSGPARWAWRASATPRWYGASLIARGGSIGPSASGWRSLPRRISPPSRVGHASAAPSARILDLVARLVDAYITGFQHGRDGVGRDGVATIVKHWVGYGAAANGFDGHNYYGRFAKLSDDQFAAHLRPFDAAFKAGVAGVMPTYDILLGVSLDGQPLEAVGASFNHQLLTILRGQHGFTGLILSDWAVTRDCDPSCMTGIPTQTPADIAMPWGVEKLSKLERYAKAVNAGVDQFGGVTDTEILIAAVRSGLVSETRLNESVLRILELKFRLGLFENPFVDPRKAVATVGAPAFKREALDAQRRSLVLLENEGDLLPLKKTVRKVFAPGISAHSLAAYGLTAVSRPALADVAILRVHTPHENLHPDYFFGSRQQEGSLDFKADSPELAQVVEASRSVPTVVVITLDRPAILAQVRGKAAALVGEFGVSETALLDVLVGKARPEGRLPFELPSSMAAVEAQQPGAAHDSAEPLFPIFFGLRYGQGDAIP